MRLIDADELKKEIKENDPFGGMNYEWYIDHASTVDTASPWHRVEEELPHKNGWYLVKDEFGDYNTLEWDNTFQWNGITAFEVTLLTHWMPIEPPKEDA